MAAQWPQQSPPAQGYVYPNYQQHQRPQQAYQPSSTQYPPPQYVPQVMPAVPAQLYTYSPQGPYQQPHPYQQSYSQIPPQVPQGLQKPYVAQPTPPVCYNCGSPEHWAQSCPEPRRNLPAGDVSRLNYGPNKRPKYTPPVVTKYPVPPQAPTQFRPQGYGGQPYAYPHYQPQYGPPTPMTTYPQHQQWPANSVQQQYPPSHPQGTTYQQQPYAVPPSPAVTPSYGPQYQGPINPQGPPQHSGYFNHSYSYPSAQGRHASLYSSASPSVTGPALASYSSERRVSRNEPEPRSCRHERSASVQSQALSPGQNSAPMSVDEDDEDDLGMLDIPDIPKYPGPNGEKSPKPVGYALPADYEVFESVGGELPPPAVEADGCIQSVFVTRDSINKMLERFTDCGAWEFSEEDPIFLTFSHNNEIIPFEEWSESRARRQSEEVESNAGQEDDDLSLEHQIKNDELSKRRPDSSDYEKNQNSPISHEASSVYYKSSIVPHRPTMDLSGAARDTEEILAALGVTGAPKPVRAPARPYPPPESSRKVQRLMNNQINNAESKRPEGSGRIDKQNHEDIHASPKDQPPISPIITLHDPFDPDDRDPAERNFPSQDATHPNWPNTVQEQAYKGFTGYPPPPPPKRKSSTFDGTQQSPISPGSNPIYRNGSATNGSDHVNGINNSPVKYIANGKPYSPIKLRSERMFDRKRTFESRDSSDDEQGNERRRQVDDVTPKLKRRQPKVAAAYDRRW